MKKSQKKKINFKLNTNQIFIILMVVLVITTISLIVVLVTYHGNPEKDNPLLAEIYNYFSTDDLTNCNGLFNYSNTKIDYDNANNETKLCIAYHKSNVDNIEFETLKTSKNAETCKKDNMVFKAEENTEECNITKINKNIIDTTYKKIFGRNNDNSEKFTIDSTHTCFLDGDYYYCGLSETFTYILGGSAIYRTIKNYEEKSSEIVIYDYFIKISDPICYTNYTTDSINQNCTKNFDRNKKIKYNFMKKYGSLFKHIYQKADDGTYYWVSSEPINN